MKPATIAITGVLILSLSACHGHRAGAALRGATVGAGAGAIAGAIVGRPGRGAAIGAAAGALLFGAPRSRYRARRYRSRY